MRKPSPLAGLRSSIAKINRAVDEHGEASAKFRAVAVSGSGQEELTTTAEREALKDAEAGNT